MAATVVLNVDVNEKTALTKLNALDSKLKDIEGKKHVITLDVKNAGQIQGLTKDVLAYAKAQAQAAKATADLEKYRSRASIANARAAQEQAKSRDTATNLANANAKLASAQNRVAVEQERSAQTANRLAAEQEKTARSTQNAASAAQSAASGWSMLGGAVASFLGSLASRAIHLALRKVIQGVREAFTEMKNVDTELTNISKVSGKTGKELETIGDAAYETATKYGVAASEYLQAVYAMQKAGMGDQSEAMGELAVKTMLVGDTSQEVATKFLLATNAAWKLEGNMERLGQIIDEADYINNNYATSLDKLAAGMPIVASVAENAGMSAEETMAALGTITAATQESGTKAATALRALILNISKEVGTFITDEGEEFKITEESIKTVQGLLEKYAKTEVEAAKASGELLDPMTAIRALFKGMAEDDLNDVELFNLLSGMGGKLRTNQLTALVKNFETLYKDMMGNIAGAAGTADSEIDLMMNSWEKKSQVLKNTWTQFIADLVSTDFIKSHIDILTSDISSLDKMVGSATNPFFDSETTMEEMGDVEDKIKDIRGQMAELGKDGLYDDTAMKNLQEELEIQQQILELKKKQYQLEHKSEAEKLQKRLTADYSGDPNAYLLPYKSRDEEVLYQLESRTENIRYENAAQYQEALRGVTAGLQDYYDEVIKVREAGIELTDTQNTFIEAFEATNAAAEAQGVHIAGTVDGYYQLVDAQGEVVAYAKDTTDTVREQIDALEASAKAEEEAEENRKQLWEDNAQAFSDMGELFSERGAEMSAFFSGVFRDLTQFYEKFHEGTENAVTGAENLTSGEESATAEAEGLAGAAGDVSFESGTQSAAELVGQLQLAKALAGSISLGPMAFGLGFATGTTNAPGGPTLVNELGPELISENGRAYIANGGRPGVINLSRGAIVLTASETKEALRGGNKGKSINAADGGYIPGGRNVTNQGPVSSLKPVVAYGAVMYNGANIANISGSSQNLVIVPTENKKGPNSITSKMGKGGKGGSGGGGGGGSTAKSVEDLAKETKDILSNIEKQAKLADNRKQYDKEVSLWEKGQKEIDKMVAQYKKAGYKETDDEVLDLLNKRFDYEKKREAASKKAIEEAASELKDKLGNLDKQAKLADTNGDYEKEVRFYEEAQEAIKEMVERYRKAGYSDDSDEIVDLLQKNVDYGEKQVKVYKDRWNDLIDALEADTEAQKAANALAEKEQALAEAREALANATKNRTVRTYNAATGQWEWVADQAKIKSAQETLTKAEESYSKEVKDQAIKELENLRDTMADLNDVILGPALSAIMTQAESSDVFQNFARALNGVYGVGSYLASTEGSSKVLSTSSDSHDTIYTFGNVTLTEEEASSMSVAQLAQRLQVLKIS